MFVSRKFNAFARFIIGVQPDGVAFVLLAPRRMANDYIVGNDRDCPIYASTTAEIFEPGFPGCDQGLPAPGQQINLNTDYSGSDMLVNNLGEGIKFRIVGAGMRVRYIGKLLDEAGIAHCVIDPDHYSLGTLTIQQIGQMETYFNMPVSQTEWITLTYSPVTQDEFEFQPDPIVNPLHVTGRPTTHHFMGMAFTGLAPGQTLSCEVVVHYEAIGRTVRGKTATPVDVVGTGIALGAMGPGKQLENQDPTKTVKELINSVVPNITTDTIIQGVAGITKMML